MTTFALLHGGGHVGEHWDGVRAALTDRGHEAIAPDVPMDDPNAGAAAWADVVLTALVERGYDDDVVLVGHSYAGLGLPVIASRLPVRRMIFLAAQVPVPGRRYRDYLAENPEAVTVPSDAVTRDERGRSILSWESARRYFYHDVPDEMARRAFALLRPNAATGFEEECPIDRWPDVPSSYVLCLGDRCVGPAWSRRVARERLGVEPVEIPGGHSPFCSDPARTAAVLDGIVSAQR